MIHAPFTPASRCALLLTLFLLVSPFLRAQASPDDAEGCKDSPLIRRMPGSTIGSCDHKEFDQLKVPLGQNKDGEDVEKTLEGEVSTWAYGAREGVSDIQFFRNIANAIKAAGLTIDYSSEPANLVAHKGNTWYWMQENGGGGWNQYIVVVKGMNQEVTADANALADEIKKSGHVAVYGIHFDTGKFAILPDSDNVLQQVLKLLQDNPDLKLRVEGHTDNVGAKAANQVLSQKRAQAVMGWLIANGIDASRLTAQGFGDNKPVGDNSTEDGRAKNRRVELAKL
jgi:outer membrane protein OmpA-like peptidoglycan-associated protein